MYSLSRLNYYILIITLTHRAILTKGFGIIKPVASESNNSNDNINNDNPINNDQSPTINSSGSGGTSSNFIKASYFNILQIKEDISSVLDPILPPPIRFIYNQMKKIVLYKPPVGIAAIYIAYHWLFKRQSFSILETAENKKCNNKRMKQLWSMDLDVTDRECYDMYGGIESTRVDLCRMYIDYKLKSRHDDTDNNIDDDNHEILYYLNQALCISCPPRSSRELFVERNIDFLDKLSFYGLLLNNESLSFSADSTNRRGTTTTSSSSSPSNDEHVIIMSISAKVIEMRVIDALLRILRDRLLLSAKRLEKNERYWSWRVRWYEGRFRLSTYMKRVTRQFIFRATLDDDRHQLSLAQALLTKEIERLGIVQQLLLLRPMELSKTLLLNAPTSTATTSDENVIEDIKILLVQKNDNDIDWLNLASDWTCNARLMLYKVISNSTISSSNTDEEATTLNAKTPLFEWSKCTRNDKQSWIDALTSVDNLPKARRDDLFSDFTNWFQRNDFKGVPSSVSTLIASLVIHEILKPRWNNIVDTFLSTSDIVKGILDRRFYTPLRDIVLDLLNRRPRLLDPFALQIEETSLDNMLRDLGIVNDNNIDGTYDRAQALSKAASMYEEELRNGPLKGLFRGNMVRLLLIQIQQLKTDLLVAMGTIDDLVDTNRLNVQLLASIPSVILVILGTRLFFIILYSFKSKDIYFPTRDVHTEMSDYLYQMERCLILSDNNVNINANIVDYNDILLAGSSSSKEQQKKSYSNKKISSKEEEVSVYLNPTQLGEFLLLAHKYLLLLDFSTPPISSKVSNTIQRSIQDLMQQGQLNTSLQLSLLRLIRVKHEELAKSL